MVAADQDVPTWLLPAVARCYPPICPDLVVHRGQVHSLSVHDGVELVMRHCDLETVKLDAGSP